MLYAKNGVITEDRFNKLTPMQWLFHYYEIKKFQDKELTQKKDTIKIITEYMELVGTMANPAAGKALQEAKQLNQFKQDINEDNFVEQWEELKKIIPTVLRVENKSKFFLPKTNKKKMRELGFKLKEGENDGDGQFTAINTESTSDTPTATT